MPMLSEIVAYQVLYALATLDIPEALSGGPMSAADLSPAVGAFPALSPPHVVPIAVSCDWHSITC